MNISTALTWAISKLKYSSSSPSLDSEVLLSFVLSSPPFSPSAERKGEIERGFLFAHPDHKLSNLQTTSYKLLIKKRSRHWPVAYLTGHKEFFGLDFKVTPAVLIPRPETELLVKLALSSLFSPSQREGGDKEGVRKKRTLQVIDLGTGSGNIIISLAVIASPDVASGRSNLKLYATDSSLKALAIARQNAHRLGVSKKIKFLHGNLLDPLLHLPLMRGRKSEGHSYLVLANLPYLTPSQYHANPDLHHEPRQALLGGPDGLKYFRELFTQLSRHCERQRSNPKVIAARPAGARNDSYFTLLLEHSPSQKPALQTLAKKYFPKAKITFHKDLAGKNRILQISLDML